MSTKAHNKIDAMRRYFEDAEDNDKLWMISLFLGRKPSRSVTSNLLRLWASEISDLPAWLFKSSYDITKDWNETIASILPSPVQVSDFSLTDYLKMLVDLREKTAEEKKEIILDIWTQLGGEERWVFNKLLTGGFRPGATQKQMIVALSQQTGLENNVLYLRLEADWSPEHDSFSQVIFAENGEYEISKPYAFQLPDTWDVNLVNNEKPADWQVEWKWQGIRSQVIKRKDEAFIWNREEELITVKLPELGPLLELLPNGTAIDGEILAWKDGIPLSESVLRHRFGRKNISKKVLQEVPIHIVVYDLLEYKGEDLRGKPLHERRQKLALLVDEMGLPDLMSLSEQIEFEDWAQLGELRKYARDYHAQGFILKRKASPYEAGNEHGHWKKWEVDLLKVKGILLYAERESRRSANKYTHFTFAVWKNEELIPVTKAQVELPEDELEEIEKWVKAHTIERFGPVRSVSPKLVFEIGFQGIEYARRRKSGVNLLAPCMLSWEKELIPEQADNIQLLEEMLGRYG